MDTLLQDDVAKKIGSDRIILVFNESKVMAGWLRWHGMDSLVYAQVSRVADS